MYSSTIECKGWAYVQHYIRPNNLEYSADLCILEYRHLSAESVLTHLNGLILVLDRASTLCCPSVHTVATLGL